MLIDVILDRRDGVEYDPRELYSYLQEEGEVFPFYWDYARIMDEGTEEEMREALCEYVRQHGYRSELCEYIRSMEWL